MKCHGLDEYLLSNSSEIFFLSDIMWLAVSIIILFLDYFISSIHRIHFCVHSFKFACLTQTWNRHLLIFSRLSNPISETWECVSMCFYQNNNLPSIKRFFLQIKNHFYCSAGSSRSTFWLGFITQTPAEEHIELNQTSLRSAVPSILTKTHHTTQMKHNNSTVTDKITCQPIHILTTDTHRWCSLTQHYKQNHTRDWDDSF